MAGIGNRIKQFRKQKELLQKELADKVGVSKTTICNWEKEVSEPNPDCRKKLCEILGISEAELFGALPSSGIPIQKVPIISWVHANKFESIEDSFPIGVSDEYIYSCVKGDNIFALRVIKDCMEPEFREGDIVIINPHLEVNNNDYVIVANRDEDTATFKQYKQYGTKRILHPLNPKYLDLELDHKKKYVIVGKVVEKIKKY